jgi:hypothetical protein
MRATCPANWILLRLITRSVQIMTLLMFQLSPASCHCIPLSSKHSLSSLAPCSSLAVTDSKVVPDELSVNLVTNGVHYGTWRSGGGEGVNVGVLGCNAAWTGRTIPAFRRNILSALKMETVCASEMLVSSCKSTWLYNPEYQHRLNGNHLPIGVAKIKQL